ncbi:hypothetical protein MA47_08760 [Corynebacterium auriscanis]|uniref:Uncharacterized protein n=1 Tax=Corynebacterium auriscanis TaxID=99807 RepID=A0A0A2DKL3_9CORY|nr:hypothetical protein MA47_08760 [Corynebacterium auriscanis]
MDCRAASCVGAVCTVVKGGACGSGGVCLGGGNVGALLGLQNEMTAGHVLWSFRSAFCVWVRAYKRITAPKCGNVLLCVRGLVHGLPCGFARGNGAILS